MRIPDKAGRHQYVVLIMMLMLSVLFWGGLAVASSSEGGGHGKSHEQAVESHGQGVENHEHAEGHEHKKGWVATDTYRVMNFAVLAGVLIFLLKKPVAQALDSRIKGIKTQLDELEARKNDAEKTLAEYNARIAKLSLESDKVIAEYIRQGDEAKARILKEAELSANKLEEQARRNIESEFALAKQRLQEEIFEKAMAKAEEIIKKNITADDQNRLVDEYLDKVVA